MHKTDSNSLKSTSGRQIQKRARTDLACMNSADLSQQKSSAKSPALNTLPVNETSKHQSDSRFSNDLDNKSATDPTSPQVISYGNSFIDRYMQDNITIYSNLNNPQHPLHQSISCATSNSTYNHRGILVDAKFEHEKPDKNSKGRKQSPQEKKEMYQ